MEHFVKVPNQNIIEDLVSAAFNYKKNPLIDKELGKNKRIGLIFLNPSLRTRLSTQIAASNLGMEAIVLNMDKDGWALEFKDGAIMNGNTIEHIKDAAPILGNYFDILCIRSFPQLKDMIEDNSEYIINSFIRYAGIPIISLESATLHPLQSLTDLFTIKESIQQNSKSFTHKKAKIVLSWAPHIKAIPHCVANSFSQWMLMNNEYDFVITHPKGLELSSIFTKGATIMYNQQEALHSADFVYVKNWSSYYEYGKMIVGNSWLLTNETLKITNQAKIMHCLPMRRNIEISDEVIDSPNSLVQQQAANRVWAAQAVIANILKNNP